MKKIATALGYTSCLVILCTGIWTSTAVGQEQERVIEEVIVTAQKREQSAQVVPIAISAFDDRFLDQAGVNDVYDLQFFVPGLSVYSEYSSVVPSFNIRGVGTTATNLSLESSVGIYVDGVYRARQTSGINDLIDLERVEVLKGPQGTLFGKNTASGAVQFLTMAPWLDEWDGYAEISGGNENYLNINGAINIPLIEGRAAVRISGGVSDRDGYVENIVTGTDLNEKDRYSVRGQLLFEISDSLTARVIADHSEIDEKCCGGNNVFDGPGDTIALFDAAGGAPGAGYAFPLEALSDQILLADDFDDREVAFSIDPYLFIEESGLSLESQWDLGDASFTSLTAYRQYESLDDVSNWNALEIVFFGNDSEQDTFTQEFRLNGDWGDRVTYVTGFYYFDQELDNVNSLFWGADANTLLLGGATLGILDSFGFFGPPGIVCSGLAFPGAGVEELCPLPAFPAGEGGTNSSSQEQTSWAIFGQVDIQVTDSLIATLGLRYLDEEKEMSVIFGESIFTPAFAAVPLLSPFVPDLEGVILDDTATTGTVKLTYFLSDDAMTYVSYGRGYKSGGTNIDRIPPITGAQQLFDPETSDSYEIGFKGDFLDKRARINAAAFLMKTDDFQANNFVGNTFVLQNAGAIETTGFELDLLAVPAPWLSVGAGVAYIDAEYDEFPTGACARTPWGMEPDAGQPGFPNVCDATGKQVGGTPKWTTYGSFRAERAGKNGTLYAQFDVSWRDETPSGIDSSGDPNHVADSVTLANLSIGYRFAEERYDISLWGKNIFGENYYTVSFNSAFRVGSITAMHTEPRMWGVTLRATY